MNNVLVENEIIQPKKNRRNKIVAAITISLSTFLIISLLIVYSRFHRTKSEIYDIDTKISRNLYLSNYFTETKTIKTKYDFLDDSSEEHEVTIYTNFMLFIINKTDFLKTAALIILESKKKTQNEIKDLIKFDIFEEEKIKEVISNPDGSKYPIALFKFYENGTISDIQLPVNIDQYNADSIIELIEEVIPKKNLG